MSSWNSADDTTMEKSLLGRTVRALEVSEDGERALRFRCEDGDVVWGTDGDCCSESWWADGFQLGALRGGTVVEVVSLDMPDPDDGRTRQEYDSVYGYEITTDQGVATLAFRNSSNGYYGGWAFVASDGGTDVFSWRAIEGSDWQA